ncbi:hypothetical protein BD779DRAFT_1531985 [Infundibulicybe gibba]|nr:hypothetical protein BD779DRAFT_1531985 [Infundibulicybe gibba]
MDPRLLNTSLGDGSCAQKPGPMPHDGATSNFGLQNNQALVYKAHKLPNEAAYAYPEWPKDRNDLGNDGNQEKLYRLHQALYHEHYLRQYISGGNHTLLTPKAQETSANLGYPPKASSQVRARTHARENKPYANYTKRTRQISSADLDGSSDKENHRSYTSSNKIIPIATPVPLPYTARSKAVLRSMISSRGTNGPNPSNVEGISELPDFQSSKPSPPEQNLVSPNPPLLVEADPDITHEHMPDAPATQGSKAIRPITPSTLMALTEPFLMSWCADIDWTPPALVRTSLPFEGVTHTRSMHLNYAHNAWGY